MSTVLITGGLGVIGAWVTRELAVQGEKVITYSRYLDTTLVQDIVDKIDCVAGDILDLPRLIQTIRHYGVERIIHLSAILPNQAEENPVLGYRINAEGSMNVLEAARLMDIKRVVATSSKGVFGLPQGEYTYPTYRPMDEDAPKAPCTVYGTTKILMEHMGLDYHRVYGLDFIALRFSSPYGIGRQVRHGAFGITSKIIESAMLGKPLAIPQGGDQQEDFIYHKDVAHSIVLACFVEKVKHRIFNVGSGKGETLKHIIDIVKKIYGEVPITIGPGLNFFGGGPKTMWYSVFNIERARQELGFSPQYDLEAGVKDYIASMKQLGIKPVVLP
ncbi:NAD-dependent epimerase/dehydratase family protein [Chloroflexota bacterium]